MIFLIAFLLISIKICISKSVEVHLNITWPSGLFVDRVQSPETGQIFRFGRLQHNIISMRPQWSGVIVVESVLQYKDIYDLIRQTELYAIENGWSKARHVDYYIRPTKDLAVSTVLNSTNYSVFKEKLSNALFPMYRQYFGINSSLLEIDDLFITKYESNSKENFLAPHQDKSPWSFVIALNDEFEGGGTYFVAKQRVWKQPIGAALIFNGQQMHGAYRITSGSRYILAGFCNYGTDTHEEFMSLYEPLYDGYAASAGFKTGDLIIGIDDCRLEEEMRLKDDFKNTSSIVRTMVPVTPFMSDEEWTRLAQSCETVAPTQPTNFIVRRYIEEQKETDNILHPQDASSDL